MTKKEMTEAVMAALPEGPKNESLSRLQVECVIEAFCDISTAELLGGGEVRLQGLGKLKVKEIKARIGRNPRTGEQIDIPASKKVVFAPFKNFKDSMKG